MPESCEVTTRDARTSGERARIAFEAVTSFAGITAKLYRNSQLLKRLARRSIAASGRSKLSARQPRSDIWSMRWLLPFGNRTRRSSWEATSIFNPGRRRTSACRSPLFAIVASAVRRLWARCRPSPPIDLRQVCSDCCRSPPRLELTIPATSSRSSIKEIVSPMTGSKGQRA